LATIINLIDTKKWVECDHFCKPWWTDTSLSWYRGSGHEGLDSVQHDVWNMDHLLCIMVLPIEQY